MSLPRTKRATSSRPKRATSSRFTLGKSPSSCNDCKHGLSAAPLHPSSLTSCDSPPLPGPLTAATLASSSLSHQEGLAAAVPSLAHSTPLHGSPSLPHGFAHLSHLLERPTMATLVSAVTCPAPSATSRSAFSTFPVSHSSLL